MGHKLDCKIVQDLLPSYIEGLTSDLTNNAMEEHLSSCNDCKKELSSMTKEIKEVNKAPHKQINFLIKIKRRQWKVAMISVFVAVTVFVCASYFLNQRHFLVPSSEVRISDVYQMKDGSIHYRISASVEGYLGNVSVRNNGNSEIIQVYEHRRLFSSQSKSIVSIPERWVSLNKPNGNTEVAAIFYEGTGTSDRITIWEKGMNLPKASAEQEAEYERSSGNKRK